MINLVFSFRSCVSICSADAGAVDSGPFPHARRTPLRRHNATMGERAEHAALFANGVPSGTPKIVPEAVSRNTTPIVTLITSPTCKNISAYLIFEQCFI